MQNTKSNKNSYKRIKRKRVKYKNRYSILNRRAYPLKHSPETMGPGNLLINVTMRYNFEPGEVNTSGVINLMQNVINSLEFERNVNLFKYFKICGMKIIIPPRISFTSLGTVQTGRILVDWQNNLVRNIIADDSSKEFSSYQTKNLVYRFMPPNSSLVCGNNITINYRNWINTDINLQGTEIPGYIKVTSGFNFDFSVEVLVHFRGNKTQEIENNNNNRIKVNLKEEENKIKNEIKENKIEEIENKEDEKEIEEEEIKDNKEGNKEEINKYIEMIKEFNEKLNIGNKNL